MGVRHVHRLRLEPVEELPGTPEENVDDLVPRHRGDATARIDDDDQLGGLTREELYERESPRAGEADFIVAKHRNGPTATITVAFQGHYSRFVDMAQS